MQRWMENDILDDGVARPSTQRLERLTSVRTKNLDYSSSLRGRSDQRSVRVDTQRAKLCLVRLDQTIHAILGHYLDEK